MKMTKASTIVFDAADLEASSSFWAQLLDGTVTRRDEDWHAIEVGGDFTLAIQLDPDHQPPQWPDGRPQQVHLDFHPEDLEAAHTHALEIGAEYLGEETEPAREGGFRVYADPAGHPFCLCW